MDRELTETWEYAGWVREQVCEVGICKGVYGVGGLA